MIQFYYQISKKVILLLLHVCHRCHHTTDFTQCWFSLFFQEKQERAIGLLVSLGPQPGSEVTPWYMKTGEEKEEKRETEKRKGVSEEEKEKKDRRLKDSLDPLKDMKKGLGVKPHKSKKKEKRDRGEKRSSGERYKCQYHLSSSCLFSKIFITFLVIINKTTFFSFI